MSLPFGGQDLAHAAFKAQYVKSVTNISITIAASATTGTQTLNTPIVTANSIIVWGGVTINGTPTGMNEVAADLQITNSTTITATRAASSANAVTVTGQVWELNPDTMFDNIYTGTIAIGNGETSHTATITSVDTTRSVAFFAGWTSGSAGTAQTSNYPSLALTNGTTVTLARNTSATTACTGRYFVVQFKAAVINNIQVKATALTSSTTSDTDTITAVVLANTIIVWQGCTTATSTFSAFCYRLALTNTTTVTKTRTGTSTSARTPTYAVLEFKPGVLNSKQESSTAVASATSNTSSPTAVNTKKALLPFLGFSSTATVLEEAYANAALTNGSTVTGSKGVAGATTSTPAWDLAEAA